MDRKGKSLSNTIIFSFIIIMILLISLIGFFAFSSWKKSTEDLISADRYGKNITQKIENFVSIPLKLNELAFNLIKNGLFDICEIKAMEIFFSSALKPNRAVFR